MTDPIIIKKYTNRRLYHVEASKHVTLDQVAQLIKQGRQVKVIEAKTEADVTAFILTQILMERAKNKNLLLPVPLLHLIIQYGESILEEFFQNYLEIIINSYISYKTRFDEQFKEMVGLGIDFSELAKKSINQFSHLSTFFKAEQDNQK